MSMVTLASMSIVLSGCDTRSERSGDQEPVESADPVAPPDGMVYVPGGTTEIGAEDGEDWERPVFTVEVKPFFLDAHPVTVAEFRRFIEATGFQTQAERFGDAAVFAPDDPSRPVADDGTQPLWFLKPGATWEYPYGPDQPKAADDHPVTQVSWHDAVEYCKWAGKRLPTEVEWEHAARNAKNGGPQYAWGDALVVDGKYMANAWQGAFPHTNTVDDGYATTAPVDAFPPSQLGLYSMGGNVWEWCADWYRGYEFRDVPHEPTAASEKVQRGGSFLCDPRVCHGYRVSGRAKSTPETSLCHVGFRCAKDVP